MNVYYEPMNLTSVIPRLCSVATAAPILGLTYSAALRRAQTGNLPVVGKLEGQTGSYVLDLDAVEALAAERAR